MDRISRKLRSGIILFAAVRAKPVTDFEFTVGDEIPRGQWEEHYLTE